MSKNGMRPVHPGEILREEYLKPLGMTPHALSKALKVSPALVNDIVNGKRGVTTLTALRLARFFRGDAESWMNLQLAYDLKLAQRQSARTIENEIEPLDSGFLATPAK